MFICEYCSNQQDRNVSVHRVVTAVRLQFRSWDSREREWTHHQFPIGYDIVEELNCCLKCAVQLAQMAPTDIKDKSTVLTATVRQCLRQEGLFTEDEPNIDSQALELLVREYTLREWLQEPARKEAAA